MRAPVQITENLNVLTKSAPMRDLKEIISNMNQNLMKEKSSMYGFDFAKASESNNEGLNSEDFKYLPGEIMQIPKRIKSKEKEIPIKKEQNDDFFEEFKRKNIEEMASNKADKGLNSNNIFKLKLKNKLTKLYFSTQS